MVVETIKDVNIEMINVSISPPLHSGCQTDHL